VKSQLVRSVRSWSFYGMASAVMTYSALILMSTPAFAGTCTSQECADSNTICDGLCLAQYMVHGQRIGQCVVGGSTSIACLCTNGARLFYGC
jgi:hypothetical protein